MSTLPFGLSTDEPVAADHTGDGKTDVAVWREADGSWWVVDQGVRAFFGTAGDQPVAHAYLPA